MYVTESAIENVLPSILATATKCDIHCVDVSVGQIRHCIWKTFTDSVI